MHVSACESQPVSPTCVFNMTFSYYTLKKYAKYGSEDV